MTEKLWETAAPLVSDVPLWKCRDALPFQFDDGLCLCELPDVGGHEDLSVFDHVPGSPLHLEPSILPSA
jgi:hypothetical protein